MRKYLIPLLCAMLTICLLAGCSSSLPSSVGTTDKPNSTQSQEAEPAAIPSQEVEPTAMLAPMEDTPSPEPDVPTEYKSALKKAKSYSDMMHMSKAGLYDQLTSEYGEQFTPEAAQYAVDNLDADWKANALAKAESYSDMMHMSKAGIYDQLISEYGEQFTEEEAQYAVDHVEADWNANALEKAKSYQSTMNMSPAAIRDQLTSEYGEQFTAEEAEYAVSHLD